MMIIAFLLISSASAGGNELTQRNTQDAYSSGVFIEQDAVNMGIIVGDGNTMVQKNDQDASAEGTMSAIFQNAANLGLQIGSGNDLFQKNDADAEMKNIVVGSAMATLSRVLIVQNQKNLAIQVGRHNNLSQKNDADAEVTNVAVGIANADIGATATVDADAVLSKAAIFQSQKNLGIQVGHGNDMKQKNEADAELKNLAVAIADATISNGMEGGYSNQYASSDASADAYASLSKVVVEQIQKNLGIQVGHGNDMKQKNEADADVENKAIAIAGTSASNYAVYSFEGNGETDGLTWQDAIANANAEADAKLSKVEVEQTQANLGVQVGRLNDMSQKNEADADVDNSADAKARASASNSEDVSYNAYQEGSGATASSTGYDKDADATSSASADAFAKLSKVEVEQTQANLGVQVGIVNDMSQKNSADAEVENAAVSKARAKASNDLDLDQYASAGNLGGSATATAENLANTVLNAESSARADDADAILTKAKIEQCQANLGVQMGIGNDMSQRSNADAEIENVAVVMAGALASNDADVDQSNPSFNVPIIGTIPGVGAGSLYRTATAVGRNTVDLNQIAESDASADAFAEVDKVKIEQCQSNLGVQVGRGNDMHQKNSANAEIENAAIARSGTSATNLLDVDQTANAYAGAGLLRSASATATTTLDVDQTATGATSTDSYAKLSKAKIEQYQSNLGVQVGFGNLLFQKNKEDAEIENAAVAFNHANPGTEVLESQDAFAVAFPGETKVDNPSLLVPKNDIQPLISGDASAALNKISIEQCQMNLGVQVGHNFMLQSNKAEGEVEQEAINAAANLHEISIEQKQKNAQVQVGISAIFQFGEQSDRSTQSHTHIDRGQSNMLVVVNHIGDED